MVLSKDLKIAICFGLIMGALISICNMCFAAEEIEVTPSVLSGAFISSNGVITANSSYDLLYIEIQPGYQYRVHNNSNTSKRVGFSDTISIGTETNSIYLAANQDYIFNGSSGYVYFAASSGVNHNIAFYSTELAGMTNFVDNLAYDLSYANLSGVLFFVVPIMAIGILVALGFYLLKRLLNKIKRAKGGA